MEIFLLTKDFREIVEELLGILIENKDIFIDIKKGNKIFNKYKNIQKGKNYIHKFLDMLD